MCCGLWKGIFSGSSVGYLLSCTCQTGHVCIHSLLLPPFHDSLNFISPLESGDKPQLLLGQQRYDNAVMAGYISGRYFMPFDHVLASLSMTLLKVSYSTPPSTEDGRGRRKWKWYCHLCNNQPFLRNARTPWTHFLHMLPYQEVMMSLVGLPSTPTHNMYT